VRLYIVKEGDTLSSIAEKYGLQVEQLLAINPQITDPDMIMPGMKIKLATGPVSIAPGQPEIGHPITPVEQAETPFMQIPVPAVEAGDMGGSGAGVGMGTQEPQLSSGDMGTGQATTPSGISGSGSGTGVGMGMQEPQLSSGDMGTGQVTTPSGISGSGSGTGVGMGMQGQQPSSGDMGTGQATTPSGMPTLPPMGTIGMPMGNQSGMVAQTYGSSNYPSNVAGHMQGIAPNQQGPGQHQPYLSTIPQYFASNPMYSGVGSYGDMAAAPAPQAHMSNTPVPASSEASGVMPHAVGNWSANIHVPYTPQMNQPYNVSWNPNNWLGGWPQEYTWSMPFEQMAFTQAPGDAVAFPYQAPAKRPCGCGGGGKERVGHYSLAEKERAESAQAQATDPYNDTFTAAEEERIAALEERVADLNAIAHGEVNEENSSEEVETPTVEVKRSLNKQTRNSKRRRSTQRRKRTSRAHVHTGKQLPSERNLPALPWLNV